MIGMRKYSPLIEQVIYLFFGKDRKGENMYTLPGTAGTGTSIFYGIGTFIIVIAIVIPIVIGAIILIVVLRKKQKRNNRDYRPNRDYNQHRGRY